MSLATALLTPILGDASPWTPQRLFVLGEAGGVYDPAQLTAEKVAWRRNLLTWSEDFTNAAWTKTRSSITPNAGTSWDGTATASKLVEDTTASNTHLLSATYASFVSGLSYTATFYAKAAERSVISVRGSTSRYFPEVTFDLSAGTATVVSGSGSIEPAGSGWYRCRVTATATSDGSSAIQVNLALANGSIIYTGDGTSGVLIDSSQFELGSTATAYQRITDFTSDFLAAFPTHSLYQNVAGTTPVTALGQPVALALDTKTGGLANLGPELVVNGDFSSATGWTTNTGWSIGSGVATKTAGTQSTLWRTDVGVVVGRMYRVEFTISNWSAGSVRPWVGFNNTGTFVSGNGTFVQYVVNAVNQTSGVEANATFAGNVDNLSIREVPGVHAIQASDPSRPLLDARVNLLTRTEEFDNAVWTANAIGLTVSANNSLAPDGTTTADRIVETATTGLHVTQQQVSITAGATYRIAVFAKAAERTIVQIATQLATWGTNFYANFDLANGTAHNQTAASATIQAVGNGYYLCAITATSAGTGAPNISYGPVLSTSATVFPSYAGNAANGLLVWGADVRLAADAAYPYQRVVTATDYADVGVPRSFLFDGMDDSLYTASNMDLSGTDKVTVLAGVRKLSDAAVAFLCELSASTTLNNGTFRLLAPDGATPSYSGLSKGTTAADAQATTGFAAPRTDVLTLRGNISGDSAELRVTGAVAATNTGDQGTGNYGSYVLFIGRRNNASNPLNGKVYQLIVRGALTDAATLAQAERYVGARTGVFL